MSKGEEMVIIIYQYSLIKQALIVLQKLGLRRTVKDEAAYILTNLTKLHLNNKKINYDEKTANKSREIKKNVKKHLNIFNQTSRYSNESFKLFDIIIDNLKTLNLG